MVVVAGEDEPGQLERGFRVAALDPDAERPVRPLPDARERRRAASLEDHRQEAVRNTRVASLRKRAERASE